MAVQWIAYCLLIAILLAAAARMVEYGFGLYGIPLRWPWAAAILGSTALPLAAFIVPDRAGFAPDMLGPLPAGSLLGTVLATPTDGVQSGSPSWLAGANAVVFALWILGSVALFIYYARSYVRLARARRGWARGSIWGRDVFLSGSLGPAVTGFLRSFVVLPAWVLDLEERHRRIVLLHEEEHLRTGDHRLLLAALWALVAMPWNLALWWQFRRLRLAIEVDCDRRVLRGGVDRLEYGELLLEVGRRASTAGLLPAAFSEPRSLLERRMRRMIRRIPRHRVQKAGAAALAAAALLAFACEAPRPGDEELVEPGVLVSETGEDPARITGVVTDASSGAPIVGAQVHLAGSGRGAVTADNGRFFLVNLPEGEYTLVVEHPGHEGASLALTISEERVSVKLGDGGTGGKLSAGVIDLTIPLEPTGPPVSGEKTVRVGEKPVFTPYTVKPELKNRAEAQRILREAYPKLLEDAGIGGTVKTWIFIDETGAVTNTRIHEGSGHAALDEAALKVVKQFEFTPARNRDRNVSVWIMIPVTFSPRAGAGG